MLIQEAKAKVDLENDVEVTLLGYISYLEQIIKIKEEKINELSKKYNEVKLVNTSHQKEVGYLYKKLDSIEGGEK